MIVASFDIATQCGVAVGLSGSDPLCWSEDLGKGQSDDVRFSNVLALVDRVIRTHKPEIVSIEAPIGGSKTSHLLVGLAACARGVAKNHKLIVHSYHLKSIRKSFCGRPLQVKDYPGMSVAKAKKAMKAEVVRHAELRGWTVPDHDAADAGALWEFTCAKAGLEAKVGGLFG